MNQWLFHNNMMMQIFHLIYDDCIHDAMNLGKFDIIALVLVDLKELAIFQLVTDQLLVISEWFMWPWINANFGPTVLSILFIVKKNPDWWFLKDLMWWENGYEYQS